MKKENKRMKRLPNSDSKMIVNIQMKKKRWRKNLERRTGKRKKIEMKLKKKHKEMKNSELKGSQILVLR